MKRFAIMLLSLLCVPCALNLAAGAARAAETPAPPAEPVAVPDTSGYQRIPMDINGYENYTLGTTVADYFTPEELNSYKSTDSDGVFNFYDLKMVDETNDLEYLISLGTYFSAGSEIIGSVEMHMDAGFGDETFFHIKKQLEDAGQIVLQTAPDAVVGEGLHINMEDEEGDTFELSWIPVNAAGKDSGTAVFVSSINYFIALMDSIIEDPSSAAAPAAS